MTMKEREEERLYLVGHVEVVVGVLSESEEDVEEEDDPEDEEGKQGEPNPTPVTPQKRAEKAEEKRRRRRVVVVVSSSNVAALVIVQLASWPASQLGLVDRASKYRVAPNDYVMIIKRQQRNGMATHATEPPRKLRYAVHAT